MNRIKQLFARKQRGILSVYFCAGDPSAGMLLPTLRALQDAGIDMVEIGIPFSDPLADGPTIQAAATRALRGGMTLSRLLGALKDVRKEISIPLLLMGYYNVPLRYGMERFFADAAAAGIDGLIIPDLPFEEYEQRYKTACEAHGLSMTFLVTPETSGERIRRIDAATDGFIYAVSSAGVTGARRSFDDAGRAYFARLRGMKLRNPHLIGFGISNRTTRLAADSQSNGVIVGSKFVTLLHETQDPVQATARLLEALDKP